MLGYIFAFLCFLCYAFFALLSKNSLKKISEYTLGFFLRITPIILFSLFFIIGFPKIGSGFILALVVGSVLNVIATMVIVLGFCLLFLVDSALYL